MAVIVYFKTITIPALLHTAKKSAEANVMIINEYWTELKLI